jgi:hypothetical protein
MKMNDKVAQLYKGKYEKLDIEFSRVWAMPSPWTFTIFPIKSLLSKYEVGDGWVDPFAGNNSPAEFTNDHNPERKAKSHIEAIQFCKNLKGKYNGILFDPPYSFTQVKEHYQSLGQKVTKENTSMKFYEGVKSVMCEKIKKGGLAISFGWNTNGFGKARGFKIIEILAIAHGGSKNDTIVTVEQKI